MEHDLVIRGCMILTMDRNLTTIARGSIGITNRRIREVVPDPNGLRGDTILDAQSKLAMPGLVNTHTHLAMTLFRGLAEDVPLKSWLEETIWPTEKKLSSGDVYYGALLGCAELISSGCTCFNDQYFFMEQVAEAAKLSGIRGVLAEGMIESSSADPDALLEKGISFAKRYNGYADGRVRASLGPHSEYSCSPEFLAKVAKAAEENGVGVHMHLAESKEFSAEVRKKHGLTPVRLMDKVGILGPKTIVAHCIHIDAEEVRLLAQRQVKVSHNPVSNMKIALGVAPIISMLHAGVTVGVGTDGAASNNNLDLLKDIKFASYLQKLYADDPTVLPAKELLKMATINGARALGLEDEIGSLEKGKLADIILLDLTRPHLRPLHDPYATVAYSAIGSDVDTVIVDGRLIMEERSIKTFDAPDVAENASARAAALAAR